VILVGDFVAPATTMDFKIATVKLFLNYF